MPGHDEALAGDDLFAVTLNYRWREVLVPAIMAYFQRDNSDLSADNEDLINNLLDDIYG